jgi:hypothetical protein
LANRELPRSSLTPLPGAFSLSLLSTILRACAAAARASPAQYRREQNGRTYEHDQKDTHHSHPHSHPHQHPYPYTYTCTLPLPPSNADITLPPPHLPASTASLTYRPQRRLQTSRWREGWTRNRPGPH